MVDLPEVSPLLETLFRKVRPWLESGRGQLVGIRTGGLWVADDLARRLQCGPPGAIDIGFHRDDFDQRGLKIAIEPPDLDPTEDRDVILVDDVLHTGRTIRAAINVLFEFGRPRSVRLAVLVQRPGRELPICADAMGTEIDVPSNQRIKLQGPRPMTLIWQHAEGAPKD